jgi:Ca-activated chloride channel family protein
MLKWLLLILPLMALAYARSFFAKRKAMGSFVSGKMRAKISRAGAFPTRAGLALTFSAVILIAAAIARPQWGFMWEDVSVKKADILFALDVSKSMLSEDLPPNRLNFSKGIIRNIAAGMNGEKAGLMAFAGEAFLVTPLTPDYRMFSLILDRTDMDSVPMGGTSLRSVMGEAAKAFEGSVGEVKVFILITDGGDNVGKLEGSAEKLKGTGAVTYVLGVGKPEGSPIPVPDAEGRVTYAKDSSGKPVRSAIDEEALKKVAASAGGVYYNIGNGEEGFLKDLSGRIKKNTGKSKEAGGMTRIYMERFPMFILAGLAALLINIFLGGRR